MEQHSPTERKEPVLIPGACEQPGRYLYCVAPGKEMVSLGAIGIEGHEVYAVAYKDICALAHDCPAQPYQSQDREAAATWVLAHHRVVEAAWKRWGAVLPLAFNTIVKGEESNAEENLVAWLKMEYESLRAKLDALLGKAEYIIQVFWVPEIVAWKVTETSPEIRRLQAEIGSKPRGLAYMHRQRLENLLKKEIEARAEEHFKDLYNRLCRYADNIHIERVKKAEAGRQMIMNLSCLLSQGKQPELEAELDKIGHLGGYSARLAGPLPPYSFC